MGLTKNFQYMVCLLLFNSCVVRQLGHPTLVWMWLAVFWTTSHDEYLPSTPTRLKSLAAATEWGGMRGFQTPIRLVCLSLLHPVRQGGYNTQLEFSPTSCSKQCAFSQIWDLKEMNTIKQDWSKWLTKFIFSNLKKSNYWHICSVTNLAV